MRSTAQSFLKLSAAVNSSTHQYSDAMMCRLIRTARVSTLLPQSSTWLIYYLKVVLVSLSVIPVCNDVRTF